jgi:hypothetical protein
MFRTSAKFRPVETWRVVPGTRAVVHANDNLPGFRHLAGSRRPRPNRALACHWYLVGDRLECRWDIEAPDGAPLDAFEPQSKAGHTVNSPLVRLGTLRAGG